MPFPYAYYKEYYDGPVHALSYKGKALFLEPSQSNLITAGGNINVLNQSTLWLDTSAGDLVIDGFTESVAGQVLIIFKATSSNSLTIINNGSGTHKAFLANGQNFSLGNGQVGGVLFQCINVGGVLKWIQIDSNGLFANGTAATPSIAFAADADTGIYREAADTLSISTAGTKRVHVNTSEVFSALNVRTAGQFQGTATSALWADLAERYYADKSYEPGTVVQLGGACEITATTTEADLNVFGIISTEPAFKMNDKFGIDIARNPFVALAGRVPCKVIGKVSKGGRIVSSNIPGVARAVTVDDAKKFASHGVFSFAIIGRALEDKTTEELGLVEVVVGVK